MGVATNFTNFTTFNSTAVPPTPETADTFVEWFAKDDQTRNKDIANTKKRADYLSYVSRNYDGYLNNYIKYRYTQQLGTA
jgi:hypothetical protein